MLKSILLEALLLYVIPMVGIPLQTIVCRLKRRTLPELL